MAEIDRLIEEFSKLEQVEAIALGGSRAGEDHDGHSDYDVYMYLVTPVDEHIRKELLSKYCSVLEIGNHYWELEDDVRLLDGTGLDVLYRNLDDFAGELSKVVEEYQAGNGYTTCLWDNLLHSRILYDEYGRLEQVRRRFTVPYPDKLRKNIIRRNWALLHDSLPTYSHQIEKAIWRGDKVSILHRTTAFLDSYFDILFALNRLTHPGEKRLSEYCKKHCTKLPKDFEENLNRLFCDLYGNTERVPEDIEVITSELRKILILRNSLVFR